MITSKIPKASLRNILAKRIVKIGLAETIIFSTDNGICWMAKYAARPCPQDIIHL